MAPDVCGHTEFDTMAVDNGGCEQTRNPVHHRCTSSEMPIKLSSATTPHLCLWQLELRSGSSAGRQREMTSDWWSADWLVYLAAQSPKANTNTHTQMPVG